VRKLNLNTELLSHLSAQLYTADKDTLMGAYEKIANEEHRQHGFRTDYMFGYVAGALGKCAIVKHEHAAGLLLSNESFKIPDYRLTLLDGTQLFVEVKNCNNLEKKFKSEWIEGQRRYARLNKIPLKIAIYWREIGEWTLIDESSFCANDNNQHILTIEKAIMLNEMAMLGDVTLGTLLPLKFRLGFSKEKTHRINENEWHIVVESAEMFCRDTQIENKLEQSIAFKIMLGGNLQEENELILCDDGSPEFNIFSYDKFEKDDNNDQNFEMVGSLSRIISSSYMHATSWNKDETATQLIMPRQEPEDFKVFIPEDYKGEHLPLWRFILKPNENISI